MIARRSVWSDPNVVELTPSFVPATDEVGRLQRGTDPESRLFQKIAEQGHYAGQGPPRHTGTRQGTYAAAPSGVLLASTNTNDPSRMAEMLRRALKEWDVLPRTERLLPYDPHSLAREIHSGRGENLYPEGGLVLRTHTRDLPRVNGAESAPQGDWRARALNQDIAWFTAGEARQLVPECPTPGGACDVPDALIRRLARLHFVDNVRGQTPPYREQDVEAAQLTSFVTALDGSHVLLRLEGYVRLSAEGVWPIDDKLDARSPRLRQRGFDARLLGYAIWDRERQQFIAFEMLAVGMRWGGTQYNRRHDDLDPAPMGIALTLAGSTPAERVAPAAYWAYGWRQSPPIY